MGSNDVEKLEKSKLQGGQKPIQSQPQEKILEEDNMDFDENRYTVSAKQGDNGDGDFSEGEGDEESKKTEGATSEFA